MQVAAVKKELPADSDEEDNSDELQNLHMTDIIYKYESSVCSSSSDESESHRLSPIPDDANSNIVHII